MGLGQARGDAESGAIADDGVGRTPQRMQRKSEVGMRARAVGLQSHRAAPDRDGVVDATQLHEHRHQMVVRLRGVRREDDGPHEAAHGVDEAALGLGGEPEVHVRRDEPGIEGERAFAVLDGVAEATKVLEGHGEVVVNPGVVGRDPEGFPKTHHRLLEPSLRMKGLPPVTVGMAEGAMERGVVTFRGHREGEEVHGGVGASRRLRDEAEPVERVEMPGVHLEHLAIERFGLGEAARLVMAQRVGEQRPGGAGSPRGPRLSCRLAPPLVTIQIAISTGKADVRTMKGGNGPMPMECSNRRAATEVGKGIPRAARTSRSIQSRACTSASLDRKSV